MAKVNPPIAALSQLNLPRPLLDFLDQLWRRTGGGDDFIQSLSYTVEAEDSRKFTELRQLTKKVNQLEVKLEDMCTENQLLRQQLKPKTPEEITLEAKLKRLEARIKHLELE